MTLILGIPIGTVVVLIAYLVGIVVGYVRLQLKVKQILKDNLKDLTNLRLHCGTCKTEMKLKFNTINQLTSKSITHLHELIADIKLAVGKISSLLSRIAGYLLYYFKMNKEK